MLKYQKEDTDELVYYNLNFVNGTKNQVRASATETRTSPIIQKPDEWLMSVVRFDVDCHALPINLPKMQVIGGITSKTATTSFITLEYKNNFYTQNVVYVEDAIVVPFLTPRPTIYNYQRWLDFVNTAVSLAFNALVIANPGVVGDPPVFVYDAVTKLIDLYVDQNYIPAAGPNQISILINEDLFLYFTNFAYLFNHVIPANNPLYAYLFDISNTTTVLMPAVGSRQNLPLAVQGSTVPSHYSPLYLIRQLAEGTASWNSIRSIVLTSNLLPFKSESIPSNPGSSDNYNSNNIFPILSDFIANVQNEVTLDRVKCQYLPTAQYRYVNLTSNNPLYTVDITMYYSDFFGNLFIIPLIPNAGMSVKILFQKKKSLTYKY